MKLQGFAGCEADLAAASLGEEAQICLRQTKNASAAMDLYLQQFAAGDRSANSSLRFVCDEELTNDSETLARLAGNPFERRVMTSYLIADHSQYGDSEGSDTNRRRWLEAVEAANFKDVESAEELALAAYQGGNGTLPNVGSIVRPPSHCTMAPS